MVHTLPPRPALRRARTQEAGPVVAAIAGRRRARVAPSRGAAGEPVGPPVPAPARARAAPRVESARVDAVGRAMPLDVGGVAGMAGTAVLPAPVGETVRSTRSLRREVARAVVAVRPSLGRRVPPTPLAQGVPFQATEVMAPQPSVGRPRQGVGPVRHKAARAARRPPIATSGPARPRQVTPQGILPRGLPLRGTRGTGAAASGACTSTGLGGPVAKTLNGGGPTRGASARGATLTTALAVAPTKQVGTKAGVAIGRLKEGPPRRVPRAAATGASRAPVPLATSVVTLGSARAADVKGATSARATSAIGPASATETTGASARTGTAGTTSATNTGTGTGDDPVGATVSSRLR